MSNIRNLAWEKACPSFESKLGETVKFPDYTGISGGMMRGMIAQVSACPEELSEMSDTCR